MTPKIRIVCLLAILLVAVVGCSKGNSNPVQLENDVFPLVQEASGRNLLGVWEIHLRSNMSGADVRPKRTALAHENLAGDPDLEVIVDYNPPPPNDEEHLNDYNPNFAYLGYTVWRLTISISNSTTQDLFDVRGIVFKNDDAIGLHNADGLTTLWGDGETLSPFKYYGNIPGTMTAPIPKEFQVEFYPDPNDEGYPKLNCSECKWDNFLASGEYWGGAGHPDEYILYEEDDVWINFAVDASIGEPCQEPYLMDVNSSFSGTLTNPEISIFAFANIHPSEGNEVSSMQIEFDDLPGNENTTMVATEYTSTEYGATWYVTLDNIPAQNHEGIYHARFIATTTKPEQYNAVNNPNTMYKDFRILLGDFDDLLDRMFSLTGVGSIIGDIEDEWDDRKEGIYHDSTSDGFNIEPKSYEEDYVCYLLITYLVGNDTQYGVLRIPPNNLYPPQKPLQGWPIMVYCHFGRFVCDSGAIADGGFGFYDPDYKDKFAELIPVYRGNGLCFNGEEVTSYVDEDNSPADWDVDDVLALLDAICDSENQATMEDYVIENFDYPLGNPQEPLLDTEKVGIMGGSRGGSVVYLAKIRDDYYEADEISRALVTIGSVTDFLLPGANNIKTSCEKYIQYDGYVPEGTYHYYLEDYNVFNRVLEPYLHGEITFTGARKLLVRSSPYHFAEDYLDHFQVHHGDQDQLARVAHTANLYNIFDYVEDLYQIFLYNSEDHSISDVDNSYPPYPVTDNYVGWIHDDFLDKVINGN